MRHADKSNSFDFLPKVVAQDADVIAYMTKHPEKVGPVPARWCLTVRG